METMVFSEHDDQSKKYIKYIKYIKSIIGKCYMTNVTNSKLVVNSSNSLTKGIN